jgi:L-2-hydroxycarboxylate dehydrogenase (NAD+)
VTVTIVEPAVLESVYFGVARAHGANDEEARFFSQCLIRADLRGHTTQGVALLPYHDGMIADGQMRFGAALEVVQDGPCVAVVDAHHGVGQVVGTRCMRIAIAKAQEVGIGCVVARNSGDFAMAAAYSLMAIEHGLVGIAMSNGKPLVAPWGGRDPLFCTNPLSAAFPAGDTAPIVIDAATSAFSLGDVIRTARDRQELSFVGVTDAAGVYTTDPGTVVADVNDRESDLNGALLPLGPKGFCWLLLVELLCSALAGSAGSYNNDFEPSGDHPWDHGQVFIALAPDAFAGEASFTASVDQLVGRLQAARSAPGQAEVRIPGHAAFREEELRRVHGVPVRDEELALAREVARMRGVGELLAGVGGVGG